MSSETPPSIPETRQTRTFRKHQPVVRFTPQQIGRQNELMRSAWQNLATKEAVIAFLNTHSDELGGEPLSLAIASEQGLRSAEEMLVGMRAPEVRGATIQP
jgi:hypothetical protein